MCSSDLTKPDNGAGGQGVAIAAGDVDAEEAGHGLGWWWEFPALAHLKREGAGPVPIMRYVAT